jgi:two-component system, LuxR family, sensor kinase FixL
LKPNQLDSLRLEAIVDSSVDCIITIDERGHMLSVNKATSKLFGYTKEEMLGKNVSMLMPNPHAAAHDRYIQNYLKSGKAKIIGIGREVSGLKKDGSEFACLLSISEVRFNGEIVFTGIIHDISEIKEAEYKLLALNAQLEEKVQERTSKLTDVVNKLLETNKNLQEEVSKRKVVEDALILSENELRQALSKEKELNDLKSKFVTLASHEFRTPLSTILSSTNLIAKYVDAETQDKRERHIKKISQAVHNLNNILNDFLSLGKLEEGKIAFEVTEFSLKNLIDDVAEQLEGMLKSNQKIIVFADEKIRLVNDKNMTRNVLINLVSNAIKYSPEGSEIIVRAAKDPDKVTIYVEDKGIGIPESEQKNIFSRFFRAYNAGAIQGTGLGLHLVFNYAEKMGGNVGFESKLGEGSKFFISLPLIKE